MGGARVNPPKDVGTPPADRGSHSSSISETDRLGELRVEPLPLRVQEIPNGGRTQADLGGDFVDAQHQPGLYIPFLEGIANRFSDSLGNDSRQYLRGTRITYIVHIAALRW
ncbi:hypothetical protein GCM10009126_27000 [Rhodanobacter caeni]|uniref:Uncharacterized protein n=1 Tax=Rhodanobacter caeni TaxID=657654 RepID=A0ABN0USL4_9GAMM